MDSKREDNLENMILGKVAKGTVAVGLAGSADSASRGGHLASIRRGRIQVCFPEVIQR